MYVHAPESGLDKPERELKAFGKTRLLLPGESQLISFEIPVRDLASFDEFEWEATAGRYDFFFGADVILSPFVIRRITLGSKGKSIGT